MLDSPTFGVFPTADARRIRAVFNELGKRDAACCIIAQKIDKRTVPGIEGLLREFLNKQASLISVGRSSSPV